MHATWTEADGGGARCLQRSIERVRETAAGAGAVALLRRVSSPEEDARFSPELFDMGPFAYKVGAPTRGRLPADVLRRRTADSSLNPPPTSLLATSFISPSQQTYLGTPSSRRVLVNLHRQFWFTQKSTCIGIA